MMAKIVGRDRERAVMSSLLDSVGLGPAWLRALGRGGHRHNDRLADGDRRRPRAGLQSVGVLPRPRPSYSGLTDLLDNVDEAAFEALSAREAGP